MSDEFTSADQAQLDQLNYKKAMVAWNLADITRKTQLALLQPAATALGTADTVNALIKALTDPMGKVDSETTGQLSRVAMILRNDALPLLVKIASLQTAAPQPVDPSASSSTDTSGTNSPAA